MQPEDSMQTTLTTRQMSASICKYSQITGFKFCSKCVCHNVREYAVIEEIEWCPACSNEYFEKVKMSYKMAAVPWS